MNSIASACLTLVVMFPGQGSENKRLPRDNLMLFHGDSGQPQQVTTLDQWKLRRSEIVRGMESVMGRPPGEAKRCSLDPKIVEEVDCGTYIRRKITYCSEPGSRVPAYLLVPKAVLDGKMRAPCVLCLHPTDNVIGNGVVVGLGPKPNRSYASELAERGFITLAPNYPLLAAYQPDLKMLGWESGTLKAVWDNMRGIDYLRSLPYADAKKVAAIGHSLGGHNSIFTAVFDERIQVVISSCGFDSFVHYYDGNPANWQLERGWCQTRYMPRLAAYRGRLTEIPFDFHELIGALAPRQVFVVAPRKDSNFRAASVDRIIESARAVYKLHDAKERLQCVHPDCGHDFPDQERKDAYKLIESVLR